LEAQLRITTGTSCESKDRERLDYAPGTDDDRRRRILIALLVLVVFLAGPELARLCMRLVTRLTE
jgi:hypothetical protein